MTLSGCFLSNFFTFSIKTTFSIALLKVSLEIPLSLASFSNSRSHSLKFLSWNIQAPSTIEGHKFDIRCFQDTINQHDFACLQEIREEVHLEGYRSFCNIRQGNKNAGGVGILVKNELIEGIDIINNSDNLDYLVCKLKKSFFKFRYDIYLINVYARPHNTSSSSIDKNGKETLKKVEEVVNDLQGKGKVILCGDFNSRIAENSGMLNQDSDEYIYLPDDYVPDNFSLVAHKTKLLIHMVHFSLIWS